MRGAGVERPADHFLRERAASCVPMSGITFYGADAPGREAVIKKALETQGRYELEYRVQHRMAAMRWISARGRCVAQRQWRRPEAAWRLDGCDGAQTGGVGGGAAARGTRPPFPRDAGRRNGDLARARAESAAHRHCHERQRGPAVHRARRHGPGELRELLADIAADGACGRSHSRHQGDGPQSRKRTPRARRE